MPAETPIPISHRRAAIRASSALLAFVLLALAAFGAPVAGAADARYEGISADGGVAFFSSEDRLVPGDTDIRRDVYERSFNSAVGDYVTREVSIGPAGGNNALPAQYYGADEDGARVFFRTDERLTADDTDTAADIYVRNLVNNTTARVSQGDASCGVPACGNGNAPASVVPDGVTPGGTEVFFLSVERLSLEDTDSSLDIYVRDLADNTTTLVSAGDVSCEPSSCGNGPFPVFGFAGASSDGSKAFFTTDEELEDGDTDGLRDIYAWDVDGETTELVSTPGTCPTGLPPEQNCDPIYGGASSDGSHVFFETSEQVSAADEDSSQDVYDWSGGVAAIASTGPDDNGPFNALYAGASADGSAVFVETSEPLDGAVDTDEAQDVYQRSGGTSTTLVSRGDASCTGSCGNGNASASLRWISPDGSSAAVIFSTAEALSDEDVDSSQDVYKRSGGETTLLSRGDASCEAAGCGEGPVDANFAGASSDGSNTFLVSDEPLVSSGDSDASADIYERSGEATKLVSTGTLPGNGPFGANLTGVAEDGSIAFFVTEERLTEGDDLKGEDDVYSRSATGTLLVSVGNAPELEIGPPPPSLTGTNPSSPNASTNPAIVGEAEAGASIKVYATSDCSGEPVATGTAEQLAAPGISVTVGVGSTTSFNATAEAAGITSPCSNAVTYKQQSESPPPDPGGNPGGGSGAGGGKQAASGKGGGILYVTPQTRITLGPAAKTRARRPIFQFTDSTEQPGTTFRCRVDRRGWRGCSSPLRLKRLHPGKHVFRVRGINAVGEMEPAPQARKFKLVGG